MSETRHPRTIYDKIWDEHSVGRLDGSTMLYVDRHLIHEVTSPQAFEGLRLNNRRVRRPETCLAVCDHAIPTQGRVHGITDEESRIQVATLRDNCKAENIALFDLLDKRQGIVHVVGPENGLTHPGMVLVCGDSHTSTHGAFGALAFGIGTSEVEHVLATQVVVQKRSQTMRINVDGQLPLGVTSKDVILSVIGRIGTSGGTGYTVEYTGSVIRGLSMESRMTVCNMSIEGGARAGLISPDDTTFAYLKGRACVPDGEMWSRALDYWSSLRSDANARYDAQVELSGSDMVPQVTWGVNPGHVVPVTGCVPRAEDQKDEATGRDYARALEYMGLRGGEQITDITIDRVFLGSCTNGRIEDLRMAADVLRGHRVHEGVRAMVVPGSGQVKERAEQEGLHEAFINAGFDWREPGCSMCLAMNADRLQPGERCASTSNRNFEGRQGRGGRTHLVSPAMAAAAAVAGRFVDIRAGL